MVIYVGSINRDHVHRPIGIPPNVSVSRAVQYLKGKSAHKLLSEYARLRKRHWSQRLWARGYWVATSGNVTDEVWKRYIEEQKPPQPVDDFNVKLCEMTSFIMRYLVRKRGGFLSSRCEGRNT
jgi:putative transposase